MHKSLLGVGEGCAGEWCVVGGGCIVLGKGCIVRGGVYYIGDATIASLALEEARQALFSPEL